MEGDKMSRASNLNDKQSQPAGVHGKIRPSSPQNSQSDEIKRDLLSRQNSNQEEDSCHNSQTGNVSKTDQSGNIGQRSSSDDSQAASGQTNKVKTGLESSLKHNSSEAQVPENQSSSNINKDQTIDHDQQPPPHTDNITGSQHFGIGHVDDNTVKTQAVAQSNRGSDHEDGQDKWLPGQDINIKIDDAEHEQEKLVHSVHVTTNTNTALMEANTSVNQFTSRETGARRKEQMSGAAGPCYVHTLWQKPVHLKIDISVKDGNISETYQIVKAIPRLQYLIEESTILKEKMRISVDKSFQIDCKKDNKTEEMKIKLKLSAPTKAKGTEMKDKTIETLKSVIDSFIVKEISPEHVIFSKLLGEVQDKVLPGLERAVHIYNHNDEKLIIVGYKVEAEKVYTKIKEMLKPPAPQPDLKLQTDVEMFEPLDYDNCFLFGKLGEKERLMQKYSRTTIEIQTENVKVTGPPNQAGECIKEIKNWPFHVKSGHITETLLENICPLLVLEDTKTYVESIFKQKNICCHFIVIENDRKIELYGRSEDEARKAFECLKSCIHKEHLPKDDLMVLSYPEYDKFLKKFSGKQLVQKQHLDDSVTLLATKNAWLEFRELARSVVEKNLHGIKRESSSGICTNESTKKPVIEKRVTLTKYGEDNDYLMKEDVFRMEFIQNFGEVEIKEEKDGNFFLRFIGSQSDIEEQEKMVQRFFNRIQTIREEITVDVYTFILSNDKVQNYMKHQLLSKKLHCYWNVRDHSNHYYLCVKARETQMAEAALHLLKNSISCNAMQEKITPWIRNKLQEIKNEYAGRCFIKGDEILEHDTSDIEIFTTVDLRDEIDAKILKALTDKNDTASTMSTATLSLRSEKLDFLRRYLSEEVKILEQKFKLSISLDNPPHISIISDSLSNGNVLKCMKELRNLCYTKIGIDCIKIHSVDLIKQLKDIKGSQKLIAVEEKHRCSLSQTDSKPEQMCTYSLLEKDFHVVIINGRTTDLTVDAVVCPVNECLIPIGYSDDVLKGDEDFRVPVMKTISMTNPKKYSLGDVESLVAASTYPCHTVLLTVVTVKNSVVDHGNICTAMENVFQYCEREGLQSLAIPVQISEDRNAYEQANELFFAIQKSYELKDKSFVREIYLCILDEFEVDNVISKLSQSSFIANPQLVFFDWRPMLLTPEEKIQGQLPIKTDIVKGYLAEQNVDLLVNTVGWDLNLKNGVVTNTILKRAGDEIQNECWKQYPTGVKYGTVVVTSSGKMRSCRNICHGVLTDWCHKTDLSLQVLRLVIWQCLSVATAKNYKSVAFPAFGTGRLEYPPRKVAETMFDVVQKFALKNTNTSVKQVHIVLYGKDTENIVIFQAVEMKWKKWTQQQGIADGPMSILECTVPAEYGNVRVQVVPLTITTDMTSDDLIVHFDQDKDSNIFRDTFGCAVMKLSSNRGLDYAMKDVLMHSEKLRATQISLVFDKKTKENIEKVFKTVRQKILSDKSDIGYLEVVTIYLEQQQFSQVLQAPPKHDERSGLFEVLLKSVNAGSKKHREPTVWVKTVPEKQRQNLLLCITGKQDKVHRAKKEIIAYIKEIQQPQWFLREKTKSGEYRTKPVLIDVCRSINFGAEKGDAAIKYRHPDGIWIYDLKNKVAYKEYTATKYDLVYQAPGIPQSESGSSVDPVMVAERDDVFASVEAEVVCRTLNQNKIQEVEGSLNKLDINYTKQSSGRWNVDGNFNELIKLNDTITNITSKENSSVLFTTQKPNVPKNGELMHSQNKKKSHEASYENIATFRLSNLELKMLKFFCEDCQIFNGRNEYKDGILMRYLNPTEKEANLQTVFKSKMDFIQSLTSSTIACPSKISDEKFHEIERAVSDTKEIYCERSENKDMITLYASNYEKMGEGKHKAEVTLGLKQQSKGRRNRVFVTETDLSSSIKEPTSASGAEQTVKRPADFSRSLSSSSGPRIDMTFKTSEGIIVKVYNGNILSLDVDCIVNAANENLNHGGGVAYVISAAAGYDFEKESDDYIQLNGPIKEGSCCTTSAGKLKYKCVIHTVGPKWYTYNDKAECCRILRKSVECCFFEAELNRMSSVATPSISAGIFGVPKEVCCEEYGKAVEDFSRKNGNKTCLKEIHFIDKDAGMISMIQKEFSQKFNQISSSNTGSSDSSGFNAGGQGRISRSLSSPEDPQVAKKESLNRNDNFAGSMSKFQKQFMATKDLKVIVVQDDIINRKVDTIVCPQDEKVSNKGGIARAIEKVCDDSYRRSVKDLVWISKSEIRKVKASPSSLPFQYVLQSVPPRYDKFAETNRSSFDKDLEKTIKNILRHCSDKGDVTSLAMPVLGIGKDGLETPVLVFAKCFLIVLLAEIKFAPPFNVKEIHIVTNDKLAASTVADELGKEKSFNQVTSFSRTRNRGDKGNTKPDTTQDTKIAMAGKTFRGTLKDGEENCAICMEPNTKPRELTCFHVFCENCVQECFKVKPVCPTCGSIQGIIKGDQPAGKMTKKEVGYSLPGYTGCGTIEIEYDIYGGVQGKDHPNPGKPFKGIKRTAVLPNNKKGKLIAGLLRIAFDRRLVFTIGHSRTTGQEGVVTWNDIHHKTSVTYGHQFGYPDEGYFDRVLDELKIKGVTEKDLKL